MKAAIYEQYGPPEVLALKDVEKPSPKDDEILIRIHASTVSSADWRARSMNVPAGFGTMARLMFGWSRPRQPILGTELSGRVEAVGAKVTQFKVGDDVFAASGMGMGCHAEYKSMRASGAIALKPANLSYDEAASLSFGGNTALTFLRKAKVKTGERVLVNGASGCVGTAAIQLAKHFGAEVTGVTSGANAELVRSVGASHVIDYTQTDFTQNGVRYDVIVDTAGTAPYSRCRDSLAEGGRLLLILAGFADTLSAPWTTLITHHRVIAGPAAETAEDLRFLAKLAADGVFKPVIDRRYALDQIGDAHRYVDTGRKRGSVVITLA